MQCGLDLTLCIFTEEMTVVVAAMVAYTYIPASVVGSMYSEVVT